MDNLFQMKKNKKIRVVTAHNKNGEFIAETRDLFIFRKVKV